MQRRFVTFLAAVLGGLMAFSARPVSGGLADLQPGDVAPDWTLPGSDGKTYRLADYRGKQAVVLAWFPKAFTGG